MPISALMQFPRNFLWGCATASHQVEGQTTNDWWRWAQQPGRIHNNATAARACEWWAGRYTEDFDRAASMHNNAQRISIEWSRIEPEPDQWDEYAIGRYRDMLQALHDRGMKPMVTLHHFTNPLWFADQGGWEWEQAPERFTRYVHKVVTALHDLCDLWCTINEPLVYVTQGYIFGKWPPGKRSTGAAWRVVANMLRGHAAAYHAIKAIAPAAQVGFAAHLLDIHPSAPAWLNRTPARTVDYTMNQMFTRALLTGRFAPPNGRAVRLEKIRDTLDWVGVQYYQQVNIGFDLSKPASLFINQRKPTGVPVGPGSWGGIVPDRLFKQIERMYRATRKPIYITEAGVPDPTDTLRMPYLAETIRATWRAVNFNYPVRGFFFWSLLDNYEWAEGYDPAYSFGLYQVDFETQIRTARPSATFYADICALNGLSAELINAHVPALSESMFPGGSPEQEVRWKPPLSTKR